MRLVKVLVTGLIAAFVLLAGLLAAAVMFLAAIIGAIFRPSRRPRSSPTAPGSRRAPGRVIRADDAIDVEATNVTDQPGKH